MSDYPLPAYAAQMWILGDKLAVRLPAWTGDSAHVIQVPATVAGMQIALDLLKERARATYEQKVGTRAAPVQYDIDAMLRKMGAMNGGSGVVITKVPPALKTSAKPTLSLDDLEL